MRLGRTQNDCHSNNNSNSGFIELVERLANLEFRAFQQCVVLWLGASGYKHIRSLSRRHRRGRRSNSGADFIAVPPGLLAKPIAVQIRHWRTPIQKRAIDELRGYMLRNGVSSGMIVTSSVFSKPAHISSKEFPGRPIHLISVNNLAESMTSLGLGVKKEDDDLVIDEVFFRTLSHLAFASSILGRKTIAAKLESRSSLRKLSIDNIKSSATSGRNFRVAKVVQYIGLVFLLFLTVLYFVFVAASP